MLLFPLPSGGVNMKMLPFAHDLENISSYSWATAVYQSIVFGLADARVHGSTNIGVCSFAVNIWFMERCNLYEGRVMKGGVPRYYNWSMRQRMKDSDVKEMFDNLHAPLICSEKELFFAHDNEPIILKTGCNLDLLNKFIVQVQQQNKRRKKPALKNRRVVRKRHAGQPRALEEEEEEEEEGEEEEEEEEEGEGEEEEGESGEEESGEEEEGEETEGGEQSENVRDDQPVDWDEVGADEKSEENVAASEPVVVAADKGNVLVH